MATAAKKGKAAAAAPAPETKVAPASPFGKVFGLVNNQVEATAPKKEKSDTIEIAVPAKIAVQVETFLQESSKKAAAEGAMKTLGDVIRPELEASRVEQSRGIKTFQMSINVGGKLTFSAGNLNVIAPDAKKGAIPAQVQQMAAGLEKIFGADTWTKFFKPSNEFQMKKRLASCPEGTSDEDAQAALVTELQKIMGARFGEFFSWEPCVEVIKNGKEGSALLAEATMDDAIAARVKQAKAEGLIDQNEGRLATRKAGTAGKAK